MKILVSCIPFDGGKSGISVYMRSVVNELAALGHELTLLVEPGAAGFFPGFRTIEAPGWTRPALASMFYHLFRFPFRLRHETFDFCVIAAANRRAFCFYPWFTIAVVHDLAQYHVRNKYDMLRMCYLKRVLPAFVRRSPAAVAISRSTARDMERYWRIDPARIHVVYNGLSLAPGQRSGWLERNRLERGAYLLYISRIEHPGKNHLNLIRAFEQLPPEVSGTHTLVLAGADWHGADEVHAAARRSPLRDRILFCGFLPSEDLEEAYSNAACYVFPSFFEGFGLSLVEAMHYGVPCCCSENSSLGEIGRGAALLFDPADPASIAAALRQVLTDSGLRRELIGAGRRRAREFDWKKHAAQLVKIYEEHDC